MNKCILHETSFLFQQEEWYGIRYFFQKKNFFQKEILEVTFFYELNTYTYRYISHSLRGFKIYQNHKLDFLNDSIPFWVRKIFYKFTQ